MKRELVAKSCYEYMPHRHRIDSVPLAKNKTTKLKYTIARNKQELVHVRYTKE